MQGVPTAWPRRAGIRIEREHNSNLATVAVLDARPGFQARGTFFDRPRLDYVVRGSFAGAYGSSDVHGLPGSLLFRPPRAEVTSRVGGSGLTVFALAIRDDEEVFSSDLCITHPETLPLIHRVLRESQEFDDTRGLRIDSLVSGLFEIQARLRTRSRLTDPWLARVVERLRAPGEPVPSLAELADLAGVHFTHVARTFRKRLGCTPGEYSRLVRLGRAAEALARTDQPIAGIALDAGFADQSHLGRHFRRRFGATPRAYRRAFRTRAAREDTAVGS
ncbi:MAG: AraC family transcriptional regulator [Phycisphaerales bacterium]